MKRNCQIEDKIREMIDSRERWQAGLKQTDIRCVNEIRVLEELLDFLAEWNSNNFNSSDARLFYERSDNWEEIEK